MSKKKDVIELDGRVVEILPGTWFVIELENGHRIKATISGRMRKNYIKLVLGDSVKVEMTAYDLSQGRITYRHK